MKKSRPGKHFVCDWDGTLYDAYLNLRLYDDAWNVVEKLHAMARLSILTAGDYAVQRLKIKESGLLDFFDPIEIAAEKPQKQESLQKFLPGNGIVDGSLKPEDVVIIGDRVQYEIRFGKQIGFTTVRILRGPYRHHRPASPAEEADFEISSLEELIPLFLA